MLRDDRTGKAQVKVDYKLPPSVTNIAFSDRNCFIMLHYTLDNHFGFFNIVIRGNNVVLTSVKVDRMETLRTA